MTLGSHQRTVGKSQTHITPRWIIDRLGPFDLDPAAAAYGAEDLARLRESKIAGIFVTEWQTIEMTAA
jgi:hypothetical protein